MKPCQRVFEHEVRVEVIGVSLERRVSGVGGDVAPTVWGPVGTPPGSQVLVPGASQSTVSAGEPIWRQGAAHLSDDWSIPSVQFLEIVLQEAAAMVFEAETTLSGVAG